MRSAANFKVRTLQVLFAQVINKHLRMNTSINIESLTLRVLKAIGSGQKMAKTKTVQKATYMWHSGV